MLADWLGELGIRQFTYTDGAEPAPLRIMNQAVVLAKAHGVEQIPEEQQAIQAAVPEHSSPREYSAHGAAGRGVQTIGNQCRALNLSLEHGLGLRVSCRL